MLEEMYQKINQCKKNGWNAFFLMMFIHSCFGAYLIYLAVNHEEMVLAVMMYIIVFVVTVPGLFIVMIKNTKKMNQIINDELIPYLLRQTNYEYQLTDTVFTKDEVLKSLIISRYGSFKSLNIVKAIINGINLRFSFITNFISSGQSSYDVFSGTYISFVTSRSIGGFIQLRDKGKAEKNKKLGIEMHLYKGEVAKRFSDIRFYTSNDLLAETYISDKLVKIYEELKTEYKKGFYLTLMDHELVIGIHNRKNLFKLGFNSKINDEKVEKHLSEFQKLNRVIVIASRYINENLV